jgi:hypothetical protein
MKKRIAMVLAGAMLTMAISSGMASAYTINYDTQTPIVAGGTTTGGGYTSPVLSATVETFDPNATFTQPWTWTGSYSLVSNGGNLDNRFSAPSYVDPVTGNTKQSTDYISVPMGIGQNLPNFGSVTVTNLGGNYNYFGLWWGSIDTYNTLEFYNGANLVATINGSAVTNPNPANGGQLDARTNKYVNIDFGGNTYDSFKLISSNFAFEADNIAVGNVVPEPGTMVLLGFGMLGLAIYGKRRMNKEA